MVTITLRPTSCADSSTWGGVMCATLPLPPHPSPPAAHTTTLKQTSAPVRMGLQQGNEINRWWCVRGGGEGDGPHGPLLWSGVLYCTALCCRDLCSITARQGGTSPAASRASSKRLAAEPPCWPGRDCCPIYSCAACQLSTQHTCPPAP